MAKGNADARKAATDTDVAASGMETTGPDVECCIDNVDVNSQQAIEASDETVDVQYCLQRCGICYKDSFLVVDGDVVTGEDHLKLLDTLEKEGSKDE